MRPSLPLLMILKTMPVECKKASPHHLLESLILKGEVEVVARGEIEHELCVVLPFPELFDLATDQAPTLVRQ
jgi:hypothetical protein